MLCTLIYYITHMVIPFCFNAFSFHPCLLLHTPTQIYSAHTVLVAAAMGTRLIQPCSIHTPLPPFSFYFSLLLPPPARQAGGICSVVFAQRPHVWQPSTHLHAVHIYNTWCSSKRWWLLLPPFAIESALNVSHHKLHTVCGQSASNSRCLYPVICTNTCTHQHLVFFCTDTYSNNRTPLTDILLQRHLVQFMVLIED